MDLRDAIEAIVANPKVATASVLGNVSIGAAVHADALRGALSLFTMAVGAITGTVICAYWFVRLAREYYALRRESKE